MTTLVSAETIAPAVIAAPAASAPAHDKGLRAGALGLPGVCYRGIEVSARLQQVLLVIEVGALAAFAVVALVKAGTGHALPGAAHPSTAWLSPWTGSFGACRTRSC